MISYIIPHRDRPETLDVVLSRLGSIDHARVGGGEVIVIDNASRARPELPDRVGRLRVRLLERPTNAGAAARNSGARASDPASEWLVMLDDDSYPMDGAFLDALLAAPSDAGALSADIHLVQQARREDGGLPEVFVGCGVAIRREAFLELGGYDPSFGYYAEEYDLAARMLRAGLRVRFEASFRVAHLKTPVGRDLSTIVSRLTRNNAWIAERYAPEPRRRFERREALRRCRAIAAKEGVLDGYRAGLRDLRATRLCQSRTPLAASEYDRFIGLAAAREAIARALGERPFRSASLVDQGKNAWVVASALVEAGVRIVADPRRADALVIGTLSPGPMIDALIGRAHSPQRVVAPWLAATPATSLAAA